MKTPTKRNIVLFLLILSFDLFASEITIMSFNINKRHIYDSEWNSIFKDIAAESKSDIILLQEVNIKSDRDMEVLAKKLGFSWRFFTTASYSTGKYDQNNAVLYNSSKFNSVEDFNNALGMKENNKKFTSRFNNVQVLKFNTKTKKSFFVVNVHVSPEGGYKQIKEGTSHADDLVVLTKLLDYLETRYQMPVLLAGDINYSTKLLRGEFCGTRFSPIWTIDGNDIKSIEPWLTTIFSYYPVNAMDHFIYNIRFSKLIKKSLYNGISTGMVLGVKNFETNSAKESGLIINNKKYLYKEYKKLISDHIPIKITIEY